MGDGVGDRAVAIGHLLHGFQGVGQGVDLADGKVHGSRVVRDSPAYSCIVAHRVGMCNPPGECGFGGRKWVIILCMNMEARWRLQKLLVREVRKDVI